MLGCETLCPAGSARACRQLSPCSRRCFSVPISAYRFTHILCDTKQVRLMESYDVVVVGAGLAGLQCTRLLAGHGLRVALVDRKESLSESVHTTGIFVRRSLEDFALPAAHLGPPIRHVTIYSPSRRAVDIVSDRDEFRIGRMGPLYQRLLKDCQAAGGDWLPATSFLNATKSSSRLTSRTSHGRPRADDSLPDARGSRWHEFACGPRARPERKPPLDRGCGGSLRAQCDNWLAAAALFF